eukprot:scaffold112179_cov36-Attheya_sp.AAC.1
MMEGSSVCNDKDDNHMRYGVVTTSLRDAAESILTKSYAIYQLPQEHTNALSQAWNEARIFFSESSQQDRMPSCGRVVVGGNLLGYNELPAKKLFRAICSPWGDEHDQPWPPSCNLKSSSKDLAQKFHRVLIDCLHEICHQLLRNHEFLSTTKNCNDKVENKIICRESSINPDLHEQRANKRIKTAQHSDANGDIFHNDRSRLQQQMPRIIVPKTFEESVYCPLDYFLYKNNNNTNHIENCSAHVDRGILICVSLTDVAGLEVLERGA